MGIASDFVLIVVAGFVGALVARMLRLPLLVGYVAAGVAVGPNTGGPTVTQVRDIELLAEIGVALLLFSLGIELSLRDLVPVRRIALAGGALQVSLTAAAAAWAGVRLLEMNWTEAIWFGAAVSLSSTMVVLKTLAARGVTGTLASRVMIGLLVFQDLAVIPMLVILPELQQTGDLLPKVARSIGIAAVILVAVIFFGTRLLPMLLKRVLAWGSRELFLVSVVAVGVGVGAGMHAFGLSFALGAFIAGIILSESEFSHQALSDVVPLRDIFGLLFFVTVGMLFDPHYAIANAGKILGGVAVIIAGKALIIGLLTRVFGYVNNAPIIVGLGLAQVGEFSFVLAQSGVAIGAISKPAYDFLLACTVLTMAISPLVSGAAGPLGRLRSRGRKSTPRTTVSEPGALTLTDHVLVAGYGRSGKAAAKILSRSAIPSLVVESDYALWADLQQSGLNGMWGDITAAAILDAAGIARARILLITIPDQAAVRLCVQRARAKNPNVVVIARVSRARHVAELRKLGVTTMVQPESEGGVEMVRQALIRYQVADDAASQLVADVRNELYGTGT